MSNKNGYYFCTILVHILNGSYLMFKTTVDGLQTL